MTRTDSLVVGTLVVLLALIAGLVGVPSILPGATTAALATPSPASPVVRPYREGILGRPVSVSPFTAHSQADRDLVALVFSGLVRNGPDGTIVPDLAEHWSVDPTGAIWTFVLRDDARWQDGDPVTADDVAFTIHVLQDPAYTGPGAGSWNGVTVDTDGARTVVFTLATPLGGFLQAATQPIAPAHLLAGVPVAGLADVAFGHQPIGSGPFAVASIDADTAELIPAATVLDRPETSAAPGPTADSLAPPTSTERPAGEPIPYLPGIEFHFYDDPDALAAAYRGGSLDAASGLSPELTRELATASDSRALHYPGSTLTTVLLNLHAGHPEFTDPAVRGALLAAIDRPTLVRGAFSMAAGLATSPIPPSSVLFDRAAGGPVPYDPVAAAGALKKAGWTLAADGWHLPKAKDPVDIELLSPDQASNPVAFETAEAVAHAWKAIGIGVHHVALEPGTFANERLAKGKFTAAVADLTVGLDPDLYPLLASSQTLHGRSNLIGLQDPTLDKLLVAARKPGTAADRKAAYDALQVQLVKGVYLLPLAFADESVVVRDTLTGPSVREVGDPADRFWDVLTWRLAADR
jgi:peptide/nickel transport system substrate-binding protein